MSKNKDSQAIVFVRTLNENVENSKLSDKEFRQFVRNSMKAFPRNFFYIVRQDCPNKDAPMCQYCACP